MLVPKLGWTGGIRIDVWFPMLLQPFSLLGWVERETQCTLTRLGVGPHKLNTIH